MMAETYTGEQMAGARKHDEALQGTTGRFGKSGRLVRRRHLSAVMNAVNTEGREVLAAEAAGYWKDQDRRYGFDGHEGRTGAGMRNRHGRVKERTVYTADGPVVLGEPVEKHHGTHGDFGIQVSGSATVR